MTVTVPEITHYTYRVTWSAEDAKFVGTCLEFPSLSWLATTQDEALHGIGDLVPEVVKTCTRVTSRSPSHCRLVPTPASSTRASANAFTAGWPSRLPRST